MKLFFISILLASVYLLIACKSTKDSNSKIDDDTKANKVFSKTLNAHGGKLYDDAHYQFSFRDVIYTFENKGDNYKYTSLKSKDGIRTYDILDNKGMTRFVNDINQNLAPSDQTKYSGGINSVIYFATLPNKLQDAAVNKTYIGTTSIKEIAYDILEITFDQEGGGKDYDDTYLYWINKENYLIDYLAYNYSVGKGGVRFRSAFNKRNVDGIIFQDYINFKAKVGTPLRDLPKLYESEQLEKLSVILTENIVNLNKK